MPSAFDKLTQDRQSTRAFLNTPVDQSVMQDICRMARRAPSGANLQPGKFHVLTGTALSSLSDALLAAIASGRPMTHSYSYFPNPMPPELKDRQRKAGFALYDALGIEKRDIDGRKEQFARNYRFFDAPVGVVVTIDRNMGKGCFMDLGMAIATFMLAAQDKGLATSGIGALANYSDVVEAHLDMPDQELTVCGIAVGYADTNAPVNRFRTDRLGLEEFTTFRGYDDNG